jgi:hypothetical protein
LNETTQLKNAHSAKCPPLFHAEGGQVEPVLGGMKHNILPAKNLGLCTCPSVFAVSTMAGVARRLATGRLKELVQSQ